MHRGLTRELHTHHLRQTVRPLARTVLAPVYLPPDLSPIDYVILREIRDLQCRDIIPRGNKLAVNASVPYVYQRLKVLRTLGIVTHSIADGFRIADSRIFYSAA